MGIGGDASDANVLHAQGRAQTVDDRFRVARSRMRTDAAQKVLHPRETLGRGVDRAENRRRPGRAGRERSQRHDQVLQFEHRPGGFDPDPPVL
jgi:hypothetical protein